MLPILIQIGSFRIHTYGVLVALGFIFGLYIALKGAKHAKINKKYIYDLAFYILLFGLLGGRIAYIIVEWHYFLMAPWSYILSGGGFVFYGGFIGGFLAALIYTMQNKLNFWEISDIIAPAAALGHFFGRLGCTSAGCCYGKPTSGWLHITFHNPEAIARPLGIPLIPTQPMEAGFLLLLFIFLMLFSRHKKFQGQVLLLYAILYSVWRFFIEFVRGDPRGTVGFLSTSQFIAIIVFLVSIIFYIKKASNTSTMGLDR